MENHSQQKKSTNRSDKTKEEQLLTDVSGIGVWWTVTQCVHMNVRWIKA